jgi:hypothetical protein
MKAGDLAIVRFDDTNAYSGSATGGAVMLDPTVAPSPARLQHGTLTMVLASAPSVSGITYTLVVAVDGLVGWVLGERVRKLA